MSEVNEPSNDDATELEKLILGSKPWLEQNGTLLIYALAAVLAIAAVFVYLNRQPSGNTSATNDLRLAKTPEDFRDIADEYDGTPIGIWARLRQADRLLDDSVTSMFSNREEGINLLGQAEATFKRLEEQSGIDDQVRERVLIGLARVAEVASDGSDEMAAAATAAWQRVISEYPKSIVKEHAESRIARLEADESKAFYKWFHEQNPTPIDPGLEPGQPAVPELPATVSPSAPKEGDAETTEPPATEPPATEPPATEPPATEPPATEPPATEPPATEPPATEPPATEPPATEPPATEPPATEPPVTEPPATEPPATEPPATEPPATEPPSEEPGK